MPNLSIKVEGLDELRKGLRNIDQKLGKEVGQVNKGLGTRVIGWAERERSSLSGQFGSYRAPIVKMKASANQRRAMVAVTPAAAEWGTARHPVFGRWMAQAGFKRQVWPSPTTGGHMVGAAVDAHDQEIADEYLDAVAALAYRVIGV